MEEQEEEGELVGLKNWLPAGQAIVEFAVALVPSIPTSFGCDFLDGHQNAADL